MDTSEKALAAMFLAAMLSDGKFTAELFGGELRPDQVVVSAFVLAGEFRKEAARREEVARARGW